MQTSSPPLRSAPVSRPHLFPLPNPVSLLVFLLCCLAPLVPVASAQSGLSRLGEFKVNTTTSGDQTDPRMAMDAQGNFVVVWTSADASGTGIFAQRYNAACSPVGSEFQVNPAPGTNDQRNPAVAMAPDGRFVIVWETANPVYDNLPSGIRGRLYDASGTLQLDFDGSPGRSAGHASVAMDVSGRFVVAWDESNYQPGTSWALQFSAAGTPVGGILQMHPGYSPANERPTVAVNASGEFVVVWYADVADIQGSQVPTQGIFARGFHSDGSTNFGVTRVSPVEEAIHQVPSVAMRTDGSFIVAWQEAIGLDGSGYGVYRRRYDAAGNALDASKVLVNTATAGNQSNACVSTGPNGEFTISYQSASFDGSGLAVTVQRFDATGTKVGSEFFANTFTTGDQITRYGSGMNVIDAQGNLLFVWQSAGQDGSGFGIYADKFYLSNQGPPLSEFRVNTTTAGDQIMPSVAGNSSGLFVTVWAGPDALGSTDTDIFAQRFDADGRRIGTEMRVNSGVSGKQERPTVAMAADGSFVVVWDDNPAVNTRDIRARAFASDGTPRAGDFLVNNVTTNAQTMCDVSMAPDGRFVVAWTSFRDNSASDYGVYARLFDASGNPTNGEFALHSVTAGTQTFPSVAMHSNGTFVATWQSFSTDGSGYGIYMRRFDAEGTPLGSDVLVPTAITGDQLYPAVSIRPDGGFLIVWNSADADRTGVFGQAFDSNGNTVGSEFRLNNYTTDEQLGPSIAFIGASSFRATWSSFGQDGSGYGISTREFSDTNQPAALEQRVNQFTTGDQGLIDGELPGFVLSNPGHRKLAVDAVGNFIITWRSQNQDGSGYGIYATKGFVYPAATVTTLAASTVTETSAQLNGTVNANGDAATVTFEYGATAALGSSIAAGTVTGTSDTVVSAPLAGLLPGQTVYFRVKAVSSGREVTGQTLSLTTTVLPPVVSAVSQTGRTDTTAVLEVTVNPKGAATTVLVEYSLNAGGPFTQTSAQNCGSGLADVVKTFNLSGLTASSTYTVRAKATNSAGPTTGADGTFTTTGKPGVTTNAASSVTKTSALLNGAVNAFGIAGTAFFEYGTTASYGQSTPSQSVGSGTSVAAVQAAIGGLEPNTMYHFRAVGVNGAGTTNGDDATFTTLPDPPIVTTAAESNVTSASATLNASVNPNTRATSYYFEWGFTAGYGNVTSTQNLVAGTNTANVSAAISGLASGGTYHFRIVAVNVAGMAYGADRSFVAMNPGGGGDNPTSAPVVTTGTASAIDQTTATLGGTVNPSGGTTLAQFEYGTTTSYGSSTAAQGVGNGTTAATVSVPVASLAPGTIYHFRLVASNSLGTTQGADATFTTKYAPPAVTTTAPTGGDLGATFATLRGTVNPNGLPTTQITFEYGTTDSYGTSVAISGSLSGSAAQDVSVALTGLVPDTMYHFRLTAAHAQGQSQTVDATFTTLGAQEPTAVTDALFVDSLGNKASSDLLANDVNNDYPPTTNAGLTFVAFAGLTGNRAAHGEVTIAADAKTVNYKPDTSYPFTRGVVVPPPSDTFQYQIVAAPTHTGTGTVNVFHFGSFKDGYGGAITGGQDADGGALTLDLAASGDFTGRLVWQGVDYVLRDRFDGAGLVSDTEAKRNRDGTLVTGKSLVVTLRLNPDSTIDGTLLDQETTRSFVFTLRRAGVAGADDPKFESFTAHMDQAAPALAEDAPRGGISARAVTGFGHFLARLAKSRGKLSGRFIGGMPDQQPFSSGSKFFADRVLLNARLYKQGRDFNGRVFGETTLTRGASFSSTLEWIKKTTGGINAPAEKRTITPRVSGGTPGLLPFDFHNSLSIVGDSYLRPGENAVFLFAPDFGSEVDVKFSAGGLESERTAHIVFTPSGGTLKARVTSTPFTNMTFKVVPATGKFSGTFMHPDDTRFTTPVKFSGAFRRNPGAGYGVNEKGRGSFLGFDNAGYVQVYKVR